MEQNANVQQQTPTDQVEEQTTDYTAQDLICLIRAIKFAHPHLSQRGVHSEITNVAADSDPSHAFLREVELRDVKKVWKRALKGAVGEGGGDGNSKPSREDPPASVVPPANNDGVLKLFTVGDGSVKTSAESYAVRYARAAIEEEEESKNRKDDDDTTNKNCNTHFFLDVPADRSGSRPHQALINYNDNRNKKNKKGEKKKKSCSSSSSSTQQQDEDGREVFKVQMAAPIPGMGALPMLLYNEDKSARTFLHPPSEEEEGNDDGGYCKIRQMIDGSGTKGALGKTGGQKAYFWGVVRDVKGGKRIVSLNVDELAPSQGW